MCLELCAQYNTTLGSLWVTETVYIVPKQPLLFSQFTGFDCRKFVTNNKSDSVGSTTNYNNNLKTYLKLPDDVQVPEKLESQTYYSSIKQTKTLQPKTWIKNHSLANLEVS